MTQTLCALSTSTATANSTCSSPTHERYCLYLFKDMKEGWATKVFDVVRGKEDGGNGKAPVIPPFVRADGTNNGAWFHSVRLWLHERRHLAAAGQCFQAHVRRDAGVRIQRTRDRDKARVGCRCGEPEAPAGQPASQ